MNDIDFYLLLDRIDIHNANAVSSPLTYGFPAVTGFLGAIHALERKQPFEARLSFGGALITCHQCRVKRYRSAPYSDYTLNQSRNPIRKTGQTASIIEEGKTDLCVSLVVPITCDDYDDEEWLDENKALFIQWIKETVSCQRMAGGSVTAIEAVELIPSESIDNLKLRLAPGFILMDARQELAAITQELQKQQPDATTLDALLEVATLHHQPEKDQEGETQWRTTNVRRGRGWLVPMPVGYQAISPRFEPGVMANCRTDQYPTQFVEALYSLGKWVFPYSLSSLEPCFWQWGQEDNGLYLIEQNTN